MDSLIARYPRSIRAIMILGQSRRNMVQYVYSFFRWLQEARAAAVAAIKTLSRQYQDALSRRKVGIRSNIGELILSQYLTFYTH
jgi:hypothetical protein